jgi:transcriptional regulator with XRE-family HTH domain
MEISNTVKSVARKNGFDLLDIAKKIGITYTALWSRLKDPKLSTLEEIAGIIGVPVSAFFTESNYSGGDLACPHCGVPIKIFLG